MAANEYTKFNSKNGIPSQAILDAGINVFGLQLFLESYTDKKDPPPLKFRYLGVDVSVSISESTNPKEVLWNRKNLNVSKKKNRRRTSG